MEQNHTQFGISLVRLSHGTWFCCLIFHFEMNAIGFAVVLAAALVCVTAQVRRDDKVRTPTLPKDTE